jgi:hypothetical protein
MCILSRRGKILNKREVGYSDYLTWEEMEKEKEKEKEKEGKES